MKSLLEHDFLAAPMAPSTELGVTVEVFNQESPFGGVQVAGVADIPIQIEINTGSPIFSVFGRTGNIVAQPGDYAAFYAPLGQVGSVSSVFGRTGAITAQQNDYAAFYAPASAVTGVSSVFGRSGAITAQAGDYAGIYLPLSGGTMTGTLQTQMGGALAGRAIALGEPSTGFERVGSGSTADLHLVFNGAPIMAWTTLGTQLATPLNMSNQKITALATPTAATDAATKGYVDSNVPAAPVTSVFGRTGAVVAANNDYTFAQIGSKPTTLAGYGITDPVVLTSGSYANPAWITSLGWSKITGAPSFEPSLGNPSANGYILSSTTAGVRSWVAPPAPVAAGGISTSIQYNAGAGSFGGDGNLTWAGNTLGINGAIVTSGNITVQSSGAYLGNGAVPTGGTAGQVLGKNSNTNYDIGWITPSGGGGVTPAALTATGDTNVTIALGGTPATALLQAASITLGWTGFLALNRGGLGVNGSGIAGKTFFGNSGTGVNPAGFQQFLNIQAADLSNGASGTGAIVLSSGATLTNPTITPALEPALGNPSTNGYILSSTTAGVRSWIAPPTGGTGTVTSFSAGNLAPLFTTSVSTATTTPALAFALSQVAANTFYGNNLGTSSLPNFAAMAALTATNDTNITLTLGGTPATALMKAVSLTLGWTGFLALNRGGLGGDASSVTPNRWFGNSQAVAGAPTFQAIGAANLSDGTTGTGSIVLSASPTFTGTAVFANINPTTILRPTAYQGVNDTSAAASGMVGETIANALPSTSAGAMTNNVSRNITSINLSAGDWDVRGSITFISSVAAGGYVLGGGNISTTSNNMPDDGKQAYSVMANPTVAAQNQNCSAVFAPRRISFAGGLVFLVAIAQFVGTCTAYGFIEARRIR